MAADNPALRETRLQTFSVGDSVRLIHAPKNALDEGTVLSSNSRLGMAKVLFPVSKVLWIESDKIAKVAD